MKDAAKLERACAADRSRLISTTRGRGFRFGVGDGSEAVERALVLRRQAVEATSVGLALLDEYDRRSWFVTAEDTEDDRVVGTLRITPRFAGALEAERYFPLPRSVRHSAEISRLTILPAYTVGLPLPPPVLLGLCALALRFLQQQGIDFALLRCVPAAAATFEGFGFRRSHLLARRDAQGAPWCELLSADLRCGGRRLTCAPAVRACLTRGSESLAVQCCGSSPPIPD